MAKFVCYGLIFEATILKKRPNLQRKR